MGFVKYHNSTCNSLSDRLTCLRQIKRIGSYANRSIFYGLLHSFKFNKMWNCEIGTSYRKGNCELCQGVKRMALGDPQLPQEQQVFTLCKEVSLQGPIFQLFGPDVKQPLDKNSRLCAAVEV